MTDLDELMRLHDAATPGPWSGDYQPDDNMIEGELCKWVMGLSDDECPFLDAVEKTCGIPATEGFFCPKVVSISEEDLEYICAACNAVPELVQRIRELEAQRDWLAQAAANAGWHGVRVSKEYMIEQSRMAGFVHGEPHECLTPEVSCHARDGKLCIMDGGKEMIFLDRQCPACHGSGCDQCHGTGMVGSVSGVHVHTPQPEPDSFAENLREWRLEHGRTFRVLSAETGILPGTLSEIENGRREPTEEQRKKIEEFMR